MSKPHVSNGPRWAVSLVALGLMMVCSSLILAPDLLDRALAVVGRVACDTLAHRQLQASKTRLERTRSLMNEARIEREKLAEALRELEARRTDIRSRLDLDLDRLEQAAAGHSMLADAFSSKLTCDLASRRELTRIDSAVEDMSMALAHADQVLAETRSLVEVGAGELAILKADAGRCTLDRALTALDDSLAETGRFGLETESLAADIPARSAP